VRDDKIVRDEAARGIAPDVFVDPDFPALADGAKLMLLVGIQFVIAERRKRVTPNSWR